MDRPNGGVVGWWVCARFFDSREPMVLFQHDTSSLGEWVECMLYGCPKLMPCECITQLESVKVALEEFLETGELANGLRWMPMSKTMESRVDRSSNT